MPRSILQDKTCSILKGILATHKTNGVAVARFARKPVGTITAQIRHAERMSIENFREFIQAADMTDEEIVRVIRG